MRRGGRRGAQGGAKPVWGGSLVRVALGQDGPRRVLVHPLAAAYAPAPLVPAQGRAPGPHGGRHSRRTAKAPPKQARPPSPATPPRKPGRPPGSKHRATWPKTLTPALPRIPGMVPTPLAVVGSLGPLPQRGVDGHCGHHAAVQMGRGGGVPLRAQLRHDGATVFSIGRSRESSRSPPPGWRPLGLWQHAPMRPAAA